jgi:hypothetical protein
MESNVVPDASEFEQIRVIVETSERTFRGCLYKPRVDATHRLSDYLNEYDRHYICLSEVSINDRGQTHRPGEKRDFVAISVSAIQYLAPMRDNEM